MASTAPESFNPFEAPASTLAHAPVGPADAEVEVTRRRYLKHEASVRSIGTLAYFGTFLAGFVAAGCAVAVVGMTVSPNQQPKAMLFDPRWFFGGVAVGALAVAGLYAAIGFGLQRLQPWARWLTTALCGLYLLSFLVGLARVLTSTPELASYTVGRSLIAVILATYIVHLLVSEKGAIVFSATYREVVRQTPFIPCRTSLVVKILLSFLIALLSLGVVAGIVGGIRRGG